LQVYYGDVFEIKKEIPAYHLTMMWAYRARCDIRLSACIRPVMNVSVSGLAPSSAGAEPSDAQMSEASQDSASSKPKPKPDSNHNPHL